MTNGKLTTFRSPNDILRHLQLRGNGYFLVKEVEIVGLAETPSGQEDVALHLRGEKSPAEYVVPIFEQETLVVLAKQILRHLEPRAIDPESQVHDSLRRIERHLETLLDK